MSNTAVFTFGRLNPPTVGHEKLIQAVVSEAKKSSADLFVFLSQTHNVPDNPLLWEDKKRFAKMIFAGINIVDDPDTRTPFQALEKLGENYSNVTLVVGEDRVNAFKKQMAVYAPEWGIKNFNVVSAGERNPDAEGIAGISASKVRQYAAEGNIEMFSAGIPNTVNNTVKQMMYEKVRKGMGII